MIIPDLLALPSMGDATQIRLFLFLSFCPRKPMQTGVALLQHHTADSFTNKLCQWKHSLRD